MTTHRQTEGRPLPAATQPGLDALGATLLRQAPAAPADLGFLQALRSELLASRRAGRDAVPEPLWYWRVATFAGPLFVAATSSAVRATDLTDDEGLFVRECTARYGAAPRAVASPPPRLQRAIERFLATGRYRGPVDLSGVPAFMERVLRETLTIPRGQVRPYGWLAAATGHPKAARAVGTAMAHNPIPILIPCHRVVRSDYRIGEYGCGGPAKKREILEGEGVDMTALEVLARSGTRLLGSNTTRVYCLPVCPDARRIRPANRVALRSAGEAVELGFRPCRKCRPA